MSSFLERCHLNEIPFIGSSSIRNRILFGFGLILVVLIIVSLSNLGRFVRLSNGISDVTEQIQPVVLTAQNLETRLETIAGALGFYLLTKGDEYKEQYFSSLDKASQLAAQLSTYDFVTKSEIYRSEIERLSVDLQKLAMYKNQMVELANDDIKNIPAQKIAGEQLNPMLQQLQSMIHQMIESDYEEDNQNAQRNELRRAIYDLRYYNGQIASELRTFLAFRAEANAQNMASLREVINAKLKLLEQSKSLYSFEQEDVMGRFLETNGIYEKALDEVLKIHSTDKYRTDIYLVKTEIGPLVHSMQINLSRLVNELKEVIDSTSNELQQEADDARTQVLVFMIMGVVIGLLVAIFMARMITHPINEAVHAMQDLAEGEGDLTRRLDEKGRSEIAMMAKGFNSFASKVQMLIAQLASSVENLSRVVSDVSGIVEQTQSGAQTQRQQTEQVATAVTEMTASVQEVASNANLAADSAQLADDNARSGQKIVSDTVASINALAGEIETGANVISKLSQDAESIGSVLDVIKGIAEQTNLLALNAAIEAARAGEQGRGFAVVADEVRTLASRTQQSTTEIESMIESLQVQARAAVQAISQGQEKAKVSVKQASDAGNSLTEITESVATITSMNIQIATASEEQSSVAEEINQNVVNISHVADDNADASNKLLASSQDMAQLAAELQDLVAQFKY
ncbi:MAG: methyl-accepting chemotaxis protein [Gammaproteobacteria bacterium]|nr:methyl-accepting chemotaxis protein [Gammaproteobacteria bacterium]